MKWSPRKVILWSALVFLGIGCSVFYVNAVAKNSTAVLVPPSASFLGIIRRHVATVAGSLLETQSVHPQASVFPVGALVPGENQFPT